MTRRPPGIQHGRERAPPNSLGALRFVKPCEVGTVSTNCSHVVVGDQLGELVGPVAGQLRDPVRDLGMRARSPGLREAGVCNVTD